MDRAVWAHPPHCLAFPLLKRQWQGGCSEQHPSRKAQGTSFSLPCYPFMQPWPSRLCHRKRSHTLAPLLMLDCWENDTKLGPFASHHPSCVKHEPYIPSARGRSSHRTRYLITPRLSTSTSSFSSSLPLAAITDFVYWAINFLQDYILTASETSA